MMSERICLLNDSFPPIIDGVANAVVNYATHIQAHHGQAVVMTPAHPEADDSGFAFPVVRYPSIDLRKQVGYMAGTPFSPEIARYLQENPVDLLHTHCPVASTILARSVRHIANAPVVFTYHTKFDIDIAKAVRSKLLQEGAIKALVQNIAACDEVWVVSRGAGENLRSLGYTGDYLVMPNGVDVPLGRVSEAAIAAATAEYDLPQGVPVFLFVGRMMWYKGIRIILDALASLREKGVDFRMVFIGKGTDEQEIRDYAAQQGLTDRCFFTGAIYDRDVIRAWYCRADLFLFPSTFDTNGLVVREAAACGLASVLVRGSCAAEDVTEDENGFLIEENAESLCAKLEALVQRPDAMHTVGENAMAQLYLSWQDSVANAFARYQVVIDRYKSGAYDAHEKLPDEVYARAGEWMNALHRVGSLGERLQEGAGQVLEQTRQTIEQTIERTRQSAEETIERTKQSAEDAIERTRQNAEKKIEQAMHENQDRAQHAYEAFWEQMDRYL